MQKEFCPYEEALALKELGFDEPCFGYYVETKKWIPASYSQKETIYPSNSDLMKEWVSAPTFSQAFRWFREKYELNKSILLGYDYSIENESKHWFSGTTEECAYKTYEEAELACLKKLIEIVKTKKL